MIVSFADADTASLAHGQRVKRFVNLCFRWTAAGAEAVENNDAKARTGYAG